jgi:hypothetical protein
MDKGRLPGGGKKGRGIAGKHKKPGITIENIYVALAITHIR